MQYTRTVLPNGLRLLIIPMPSVQSVTTLVMVGAGSRYETKKNNGISHFLEHMAFKGTEKRPTAVDISSLIDGIGGEFNAFTSKETTGYYVKSAASHVELTLDVLSDMLQHSKLDPAEIEKEKGVIIEEINLYEDTPARKIGDVYEQLLYGDTPMGWDIAGTPDIIRTITHEDFLSYMGSLYSPDNMTVVVAGGIEVSKIQELVNRYFGGMKRFEVVRATKVTEKQTKPDVFLKQKKTEQAHIALGVRTFPTNDKRRYALSLLATVLGGGMSSRLFHEVREKRGLSYYVRTSSEHYVDCGSLVSTAGVDPKRIDEAIEVMMAEYNKIKEKTAKVTKEELEKAKEYTKGHLVLELEDSRSVAVFYAMQELLEDTIETPEELTNEIQKVDLSQIENVVQEVFVPEKLNLAVIGQFEDPSRFEKLLQF